MGFEFIKTKNGKIIISIVLLLYLVLLVKVILFKYPIDMITTILKTNEVSDFSYRLSNSNFVPMKTIFNYIFRSQNVRISMRNIFGNIVAFIPLGFLLPIVFRKMNKFRAIFLISFSMSLMFEVIQLMTGTGDFDVDDIILNVIGSISGYILYRVIILLLKTDTNY